MSASFKRQLATRCCPSCIDNRCLLSRGIGLSTVTAKFTLLVPNQLLTHLALNRVPKIGPKDGTVSLVGLTFTKALHC